MKNVAIILAVAAFFSVNANAKLNSSENVKFVGDVEYASLCKAAVNDDVELFKRGLRAKVGVIGASKREVLNILKSEDNFSCAGMSIAEFSAKRNATQLIEFLKTGA